jgi:lysophospholipase L1-like esterase
MKPPFYYIAATLFVFGAHMHAAVPREAGPVTLVAFGDSTTATRGSTKVYASVLQDELRNVRVVNAGVGGNTTELARKRFEQDVLSHEPRIAVIQFGINDSAVDVWKTPPADGPRVPLERYEANLRYFVQTLKRRNASVVLMTSSPLRWTPKLREMYGKAPYNPEHPGGFNALLVPYCEAARRVAREEGAELLDIQQAFEEQARKLGVGVDAFLSDGMHPNDEGHRLEARVLRERILLLAKQHDLPVSAIDATSAPGHLARLADGRLALVWNRAEKGRAELHLALSGDDGRTWAPALNFARGTPGVATYPFVAEIEPGELWIGYHNVPKGWNFPRARHLRIALSALPENSEK